MPTPFEPPSQYRFVRRRWHVLFRLVDFVGYRLARFLARIRRTPQPVDPAEVRRVLLIQLDHLGDAVMTTSLLPALRRHYRHAAIDVLAAPWNAAIFGSRGEVGRIHLSGWNRFRRGCAWLWPFSALYWGWTLRRSGYDVAVDVRGEFSVALVMALAGISRRVGWDCAGGGFLLTDSTPYEPGRHEIESRRALLTTLGAAAPRVFAPAFAPTEDAERFIGHMLGDFRRGGRPLVVFHVGAGTQAKTWPVEHWRELIGRAVVELDANVVLVGGNGEVAGAREITHDRYWPNVMDWTGRLSLDQLAALARRANVFLGADSGPAHLAAAAGANVVVLFSGTNDPNQWRPWGERVRVVRHAVPCAPCFAKRCPLAGHPCMTDLTPSDVLEAVQTFVDAPTILSFTTAAAAGDRRRGESA
jgi:lipopolysaccharide heptosyltransferase II